MCSFCSVDNQRQSSPYNFFEDLFWHKKSLLIHNNNLLQSHTSARGPVILIRLKSHSCLFEGFAKLFTSLIYYLGNTVSTKKSLWNTVEHKISGTKSPVIYFKYSTCNINLDATVCKGASNVGNTMHRFSLKDKKDFNSQKTSAGFLSFEIMQWYITQRSVFILKHYWKLAA